jgi:hypothetical protein
VTAPGRLAEHDPVRRPVAGPAVALGVDEGLEKQDLVAVGLLPLAGQAAGDGAEQVRGKVRDLDPGGMRKRGL